MSFDCYSGCLKLSKILTWSCLPNLDDRLSLHAFFLSKQANTFHKDNCCFCVFFFLTCSVIQLREKADKCLHHSPSYVEMKIMLMIFPFSLSPHCSPLSQTLHMPVPGICRILSQSIENHLYSLHLLFFFKQGVHPSSCSFIIQVKAWWVLTV